MKPIRTLVAPIVIAAITVTGISTAQARADNGDLAKFLIGLAAVAAISGALDDGAQAQKQTTTTRHSHRAPGNYRNLRRYNQRFGLPVACLRIYHTNRGDARLFSPQCLQRKAEKLAKLPKDCRRRVVTRHGRKWAYAPRCLKRAGFHVLYPRDRGYAYGAQTNNQGRAGSHIVWGN